VSAAVNTSTDMHLFAPQVDTATIKPQEWERLRTGIALKTFTALMKRYCVIALNGSCFSSILLLLVLIEQGLHAARVR
jgi:hypothetical protein